MNPIQNDLSQASPALPEGFRYQPDFLSAHEERDLVERLATLPFKEAQAAHRRRPIWRAGQIRDGLMIAMLAYCPIRLKNFSELRLGHSFVREQDRWAIKLPGLKVKNRRPDLHLIRQGLNPAIGLYLTWARPRLLRQTGEFMIGD